MSVGGLVTGTDLVNQLAGRLRTDALLLPRNMLREREDVFLDGMTMPALEKALGVRVLPVGTGEEMVETLFAYAKTRIGR